MGYPHPLGLPLMRRMGPAGVSSVPRLQALLRGGTCGNTRSLTDATSRTPTLGPGNVHPHCPRRDCGFLLAVDSDFLWSNRHKRVRVRDSDGLVQSKTCA